MAAVNTSVGINIFPNGTLWMCDRPIQRSRGIFFGDNPLTHTMSVLVLQISCAGSLTTILRFLFTPLGESSFFPHMLAGLIMGPSVLGQIGVVRKYLFPIETFFVSEIFSLFGCMLFMFLIGVKIDPGIIFRTGKKAWAIGICSFVMPLILSSFAAFILRKELAPELKLYKSLPCIAFLLTTSSFQVTAIHLADLKLLNSEIGRVAVSSALVSGTISVISASTVFTGRQSSLKHEYTSHAFNLMMFSWLVMVLIIMCVLRPIMLWMVRQTPQGHQIKESYIICVFLMLFGCALFSEVIGEHFMLGPIILGVAVPEGRPLGSAVVKRLDTMVSAVFLPLYYIYSGVKFKLFVIDTRSFVIVQLLAMLNFSMKVIATLLPSLFWKMPVTDAISLGILMNAQGITQLLYLQTAVYLRMLDEESYGNVLIAMLWLTGATTPIVKFLYDPSKRYLSMDWWRTIEHTSSHVELRLMACIHSQENTLPIINLLEMSNPTQESPICLYVMHLVQLIGRSAPLFIDHQARNKTYLSNTRHSDHVLNAFRSYEQHNPGLVVKLFTSISPYETMHDEICLQVAEKGACMLIVPFHRQWITNEITESAQPIRALNRHLLRTAPCSVGVLIERGGTLSRNNPLTCVSFYSVGIVFIEGPDDREALAYAMRMANHPNVSITLIRLMEPHKKSKNLINKDLDGDMIHQFKVDCIQIKRHDYREEIVRDSVEMVNVIRSLEGCFDLILVGRRHATEESSLFCGLTEWNEYPELGPVGDMLVASDSTFDGSVLVVQQQKRSGVCHQDLHLDPAISTRQETLTIVEVPRDRKSWSIA